MTQAQSMTETEFLNQASQVFSAVEALVDQWAAQDQADIESQLSAGVLEIECPDDKTLVINVQSPMRQIWLASPFGAFHFVWNGTAWQDTRQNQDFWSVLHAQASRACGVSLARPPLAQPQA